MYAEFRLQTVKKSDHSVTILLTDPFQIG
jgi:hypothetical protein